MQFSPDSPSGFNEDRQGTFDMKGMTPNTRFPAMTASISNSQSNFGQPYSQDQYSKQSASPAVQTQSAYTPSATQLPQGSGASSSQPIQYQQHRATSQSSGYAQNPQATSRGAGAGSFYNPPKPAEVFHLNEAVHGPIPEEVRQQFQTDEHGRVLFFTAPPLDPLPPVQPGQALGHSLKFLAAKSRRQALIKRKHEDIQRLAEESARKARASEEAFLRNERDTLLKVGLERLSEQMLDGTEAIYRSLYGDQWEEGMRSEMDRLKVVQEEERMKRAALAASKRMKQERETVLLDSPKRFVDDWEPYY